MNFDSFNFSIYDTGANTVGNICTMTQQAPSFPLMCSFGSLVLTSNLPVVNEYVGQSTRFPIIQDYVPNDLDISTFYDNIVYNAIFPYRTTDLISETPFYSVELNAYIRT